MCYNISIIKISNSSVAQLVEQSTVNALVAGSSPARGAITKEIVSETKIVLYMLIIAILIGILVGKILAILYI